MAYATINKPTDHFNTVLYTGNGNTDRTITVGFQPDFVWYKERGSTDYHTVIDSIRGATKRLFPNATEAVSTNSESIKSFVSSGYTVGNNSGTNANGDNYVSWNWKAGGTGSSNTDGSVTSTVSVNNTAGFSIFSFTSAGASGTVGHGLSQRPDMIIFKGRNTTSNWAVYNDPDGDGTLAISLLNDSAVNVTNSSPFTMNDSVFTWTGASSYSNTNGTQYICYAFRSVKGYSKIGQYTGSGNADGVFVYTGFKPALVIGKATARADVWWMHDNKRDIDNPVDLRLMPNSSSAESAEWDLDYLSNGFKIRTTDAQANGSGEDYLYMAFAEAPLVGTNNIPTTAR